MEFCPSFHVTAAAAGTGFAIFAAILAIIGIWDEDFWQGDLGIKLFLSSGSAAILSLTIAGIAKWLL